MSETEGYPLDENTPDQIKEEVRSAAADLGFTDLLELSVARTKLWESPSAKEDKKIIEGWMSQGRKIADQMDPNDHRPRIGFWVATAGLCLDAGLEEDAIELFREAINMAHESNDWNLANRLHTILHGKPYEDDM